MKGFTLSLLATAAVVAASASAHADNLADLKAQIETLNARVATLEATPSVPAGYSMISFSKEGDEHIISIMPTADAPAAPTTSISWSGYVRGAVVSAYDSSAKAGSQYTNDIEARAKLKVSGKTDTAVGEVGATIELRTTANTSIASPYTELNGNYNSGNPVVQTDGYFGWWKMTPNLTLSGGIGNSVQKGTLAKSAYSFDAQCSCYYTDGWGAISNTPVKAPLSDSSNAAPAQIALAYNDGPLGLAVALEDAGNDAATNASAFGVSGKASYKGDMFSADLSGGYWGHPTGNAAWNVSAGVGMKMDMVSFGAALGTGNGGAYQKNIAYTGLSAYAIAKIADQAQFELGFVHDFGTDANDKLQGASLYEAGLYYNPVKQLTLGVEGQYQVGGVADQSYVADLVTIFRF
ncbi:MAG: hypothetical protein KGO53_04440 [Alphaproteobacteria bacterium]|nr:hypothetical protein [Alphaproteobacteria bacterium]